MKFKSLPTENDEDVSPPTEDVPTVIPPPKTKLSRRKRIAAILIFLILASSAIAVIIMILTEKTSNNNSNKNKNKKSFIWGTSTASYQIEGAIDVDGRLPSIWDTFCLKSNKVYKNESGEIADNSYKLYETDIKLLANLGVSHYRFSLAWPRILPDGINVNMKAIEHYYKVFNTLKKYNIEPLVTLFHWDLPQSVHDATNGGWINETIIDYFVLYAKTVFQYFGNNATLWATFNEPWTVCVEGYLYGVHAPGRCSDHDYCPDGGNSSTEPYLCAHNILLSHAYTSSLFHNNASYNQNGTSQISMVINVDYSFPASNNISDINASDRAVIWSGAWFADPLYFGDYPSVMRQYIGSRLPLFTPYQQLLLINSTDYFALNHYTTKWHWHCTLDEILSNQSSAYSTNIHTVSSNEKTWETDMESCGSAYNPYNGSLIGEFAASSWLNVVPNGFYNLLHWVQNRYISVSGHDIYVTENGVDAPTENETSSVESVLNDEFRIDFLKQYIGKLFQARDEGVNVNGYFVWSLLDNFEWADGYSKRFGIHYVDYKSPNLTRTPKKSAKWYKKFIGKNP